MMFLAVGETHSVGTRTCGLINDGEGYRTGLSREELDEPTGQSRLALERST
jgi:hypothetical protein